MSVEVPVHEPRYGYTLPIEGRSLAEHGEIAARAEAAGFTDAWSGEVDGIDGFTPLIVSATATDKMRLGAGVVSAFTRGPALLAMSAASAAEVAPGRFCLGIGAGSNVVVERWNDIPFEKPLGRVRDTTIVVRKALAGEKVKEELPTVSVNGFRLSRPPAEHVPIFLAALRPKMLALGGRLGDGVLLNWLSPEDVGKAVVEIDRGAAEEGRPRPEVACRVFVCPGQDARAEVAARRFIAAYMTVPVYAEFQKWLGRGELLTPMNEAWADRRRQEATELVPEEVIHDLIMLGDRDSCFRQIQRYRDFGVDTVILHFLPSVEDMEEKADQVLEALWELAPNQ
jgi:probable F420-dependent oxidoreductase